jgi:DNA-binding transcriptional ArsR family regulator
VTKDREWDPETVFEVLGSELARRILALSEIKPCSAEELADHCDVSKPTVYRRLNVLQEHDLLVERSAIDDEGNHYKTYETALESICFAVEAGRFEVDIELAHELVDAEADLRTVGHEIVSEKG